MEDDDEATYDEDEDEEEAEEGAVAQEKYDYSRYGAAGNATQIFGNTDEYLFWTGMVFLASAIGNGVVGFLQHKEWDKANQAVVATEDKIKTIKGDIETACQTYHPDKLYDCIVRVTRYAEGKDPDSGYGIGEENLQNPVNDGRPLYILNQHLKVNSDTRDSYNRARIIFFSAAAVSLGISITLFAW